MSKRRQFAPEFKARVVLDVLTGGRSQAEECRKHACAPNLLAAWQAAFLLRGRTSIFDDDSARSAEQVRIAALEQILRAHDPGE
jgi:transposase